GRAGPDHRLVPGAPRHHRRHHLHRDAGRPGVGVDRLSEAWPQAGRCWRGGADLDLRPARGEEGVGGRMAKTDANPPLPLFPGEYVLQEVSPEELQKAVKPKQFIHIDQSECIMCEGCVDICPWKCIHMLTPQTVAEAVNTAEPGIDPEDQVVFVIDEDVCTRRAPCVDRR